MAFPSKALNWNGILPNQRITFVSVIDAMQNFLYGIKTHMLAHGHSVVWSASGGTGPTNSSDHTDRWTSAATVTPRATVAAASQGWVVLLRPDGAQVLLTFQGASDDIARVSFSPGALFTLAGTTNNQPTATDEQVLASGQSLVNATASADRVWQAWADSTGNNIRYVIFRSNQAVCAFGIEQFTSVVVAPCVISPAIRGFFYSGTNGMIFGALVGAYSSTQGSVVRSVVSSVGFNAQCGGCGNVLGGVLTTLDATLCETIGSLPLIRSLGIYSGTAGTRGPIGNLIDWWGTSDSQVVGTTTTDKAFVIIHTNSSAATGALWPWDGTTVMATN